MDNSSFQPALLFADDVQRAYVIQFWIFVVSTAPSMACLLFALYHLLHNRALWTALHNHVIILILIVDLVYEMISVTLYIHYFRTYETVSRAVAFRLFWGFFDWAFYMMQHLLFTWVTIERHILVFHDHLVSTKRKRFLFHYLPPTIILIYCFVFYTVALFGTGCEYDLKETIIGSVIPCSYTNTALSTYDTAAHWISSTFVIVLSNLALLLRVVWQKHHARGRIHWRQHRKLVIQVLVISSIYLAFTFPYAWTNLLILTGVLIFDVGNYTGYAAYATFYVLFCFPMVTTAALPELRSKVRSAFRLCCGHNAVVPRNRMVMEQKKLPVTLRRT